MRRHQRVYLVPSREQVGAIDAQFVGQMLGRNALRDPAQDLDDGGTVIAGLPPDRGGEQVKDRAALTTALVGNERSPPPVGRLIGRKRMTARAV
jgi:hypothetical protein